LNSDVWQLSKILLSFPNLVNQAFDSAEVPNASSLVSNFDGAACDVTSCVAQSLQSSEQKNNGWILENFPRSVAQLRALAAAGLLPHCVVIISVRSEADSMPLNRERQAIVSELQHLGVFIIRVTSPDDFGRTKSDSSSSHATVLDPPIPLKRTMSDSSIRSFCSAAAADMQDYSSSLYTQALAGIETYLHATAVRPYSSAFSSHSEKRYAAFTHVNQFDHEST
jgi:hypothetical protein